MKFQKINTLFIKMKAPHQLFWGQVATSYDDVSRGSKAHLNKNERIAQYILESNATSVLNLGCGSGVLEEILLQKGYNGQMIAVDGSNEMLSLARERVKNSNVTFVQTDINNLQTSLFEGKKFDLAVLVNVLFLLDDKVGTLKKVYSLLQPNSFLLLVDPKPKGNIWNFFHEHLFGKKSNAENNFSEKVPTLRKLNSAIRLAHASYKLDKMEKQGLFKYATLEELKNIIESSGFQIFESSEIQAKQNWFIKAKK